MVSALISALYGFDQQISRWVAERTKVVNFGPARAIGIVKDGQIVAGVVYSNFREGNIEATLAVDDKRWASRAVLKALFAYPFCQLGCRRLTCIIPADNTASVNLCTKLGFTIEGRCRQVFGPVDGIICGLLATECKWITMNG